MSSETAPSRLKLITAFAAIYVVWGSTYLAILFAIETLPPFLMASARFLIAGALVYAWARLHGRAARPTRAQWRAAAVVGTLLLLGGNGLVVWAETRVPSGVTALLIGMLPCWMVLFDWLRPRGVRPGPQIVLGLVLGLAGLVWLIGPDSLMGGGRIDLLGAFALLVAEVSWAAGSIYSRHAPLPPAPFLSTAMQMLAGSVALFIVSVALGEPWHMNPVGFTSKSILAWAYLIVFGSIVAYSAYVWLLQASTPARVSTYAYVNPVIAVFLGWLLADEALTTRMLIAAVVIVGGVVLITLAPKPPPAGAGPAPEPAEPAPAVAPAKQSS